MRSSSLTTAAAPGSSRSFSTTKASSSAGSTQPRSSPASIRVRALSVSSSSVSWLWVTSESMSFRFFERYPRPSLRAAGYRPSNARRRKRIPRRVLLADYGRFRRAYVVKEALLLLRAFLHRPARPAVGQQLGGALRRDALDRIARPERRVRLAIGHVGAEPALLEDDRLAADRIVAELLQRGCRFPAAALARLGELEE